MQHLFEYLAVFPKILLTGPHRSMSTIAATMIAADTGHELILEEQCWFSHRVMEGWLYDYSKPVVIQAPWAASMCHQYSDVFVIFMIRPVDKIETSQQRMWEKNGKPVWWPQFEMGERSKYHTDDFATPLAQIKYENWTHQQKRLPNHLSLHSRILEEHPLFIRADQRQDFHVRQTRAVG